MDIILLILLIILFVILATFAIGGILAAPYLPTLPKQRKHIISLIDLKKGNIVYDLGCGDGSLLFACVKKNPGIKTIGFEIALLPYLIGVFRKFLGRHKNVNIKYRNLFSQKIEDADIIFVFLQEKCYPRLINKFKKELKDNCLVVVEAWPLKNTQPYKTIQKEGFVPVYFYKGRQFTNP